MDRQIFLIPIYTVGPYWVPNILLQNNPDTNFPYPQYIKTCYYLSPVTKGISL